eukprot:SAG31_NODE_23043_length_512_cov_1.491525_1_plen_84_part_10
MTDRMIALVVAALLSPVVLTAKPNVIWILLDDFGYNDWGLHNKRNSDEMRTPNMDALATSPHGVPSSSSVALAENSPIMMGRPD